MRFLRVELRSFKGVEHAEVRFEPTGVTVVAGPNEVGKSSLAEAIDLLFDRYDSSRAKDVMAVVPVHRDANPEITLEFTAGPYHATYTKQFNRATRTELTVHAPRPESHTGREAHDRALALLEETVDTGLWKALRIHQGAPLDLPQLDGHRSLAGALDRAAGEARAGEAELSLFAAAEEEFRRYWTATGREGKDLADAAAEVERHRDTLRELDARLRQVESDVDASRQVERQLADEEVALVEARERADALAARVARLETLERALEGARSRASLARSAREQAAHHLRARRELVARLERDRQEDASLRETAGRRAPELERLKAAEASARERLQATRSAAEAALRTQERAAADLEFRRAELDHQTLSERLQRVREAAEAARGAEAVLEGTKVTPALVEEIRAANLALEKARAAAEAGSPLLRIEALGRLDLESGAGTQALEPGATWEARAADPVEVRLGDVARVRVEPAGDSRTLVERVRAREKDYAALLARAGVADLDGAVAAERARTEAGRIVADRERVLRENLRDLSVAELEHKVASLARRVAAYPAERPEDPPLPPDFERAQEDERAAKAAAENARRAAAEAEAAHAAAAEQVQRLERELRDQEVAGEQRAKQLARQQEDLEAARAERSDASLEEADAAAGAALNEAAAAEAGARAALEAEQPAMLRAEADNAAQVVRATERRIGEQKERRLTLRGRLEAAGQEGLAEKRGAAALALARAEREEAGLRRRAAAARLLFDTLRERRDAARRRYVQPLTEGIQRLGRYVFDEDVRVELADDLRIASRTLGGRTVPFESLSGGAREQLSMLVRLACALVVAEDGGVPLLFDDALGYSDAARLERLGVVLSLAGKTCQVVVLTCAPERYRNVGAATVVQLTAGAEPLDA